MVEWRDGRMAEWRNGEIIEWRNGGMAEWWNGGMAKWRNGGGGMAEWHNVQYEIVRNQDTESTQMPPWRSPSRLVRVKDFFHWSFYVQIGVLQFVARVQFLFKIDCN